MITLTNKLSSEEISDILNIQVKHREKIRTKRSDKGNKITFQLDKEYSLKNYKMLCNDLENCCEKYGLNWNPSDEYLEISRGKNLK